VPSKSKMRSLICWAGIGRRMCIPDGRTLSRKNLKMNYQYIRNGGTGFTMARLQLCLRKRRS
jgi:hypothetical protein